MAFEHPKTWLTCLASVLPPCWRAAASCLGSRECSELLPAVKCQDSELRPPTWHLDTWGKQGALLSIQAHSEPPIFRFILAFFHSL